VGTGRSHRVGGQQANLGELQHARPHQQLGGRLWRAWRHLGGGLDESEGFSDFFGKMSRALTQVLTSAMVDHPFSRAVQSTFHVAGSPQCMSEFKKSGSKMRYRKQTGVPLSMFFHCLRSARMHSCWSLGVCGIMLMTCVSTMGVTWWWRHSIGCMESGQCSMMLCSPQLTNGCTLALRVV
jgi:hypothetical protein